MPTVPTYDTPQVEYRPGPQGRVTSPDFPDVAGQQTQRLARAALGAGSEFGKIAEEAAKQVNDSRILDAMNRAIKARTDMHVQAVQLRGRNALERPGGKALPDEFAENLEKELGQIRDGLGNEVQKEEFTKQSATLINQFRTSLADHMVREQRQFDDDNDKATVQVATEQASLLYGDESVRKQSSGAITAAVQSRAKRLGWDDKQTQAAMTEAMSPMHVGIMQGFIKSGSASKAREYYEQNSAQMTLQARVQMQGLVKEASDLQVAESEADRVWGEIGPKGANDAVKLFDMEKALREKLKDNPEAMQKGLTALRQRAQSFNAQQSESNAAGINAVYGMVDSGVGMAQIQRSDAWLGLPEAKRHEIIKSLEAEAMVRAQRASYWANAELANITRNEKLALIRNGDAFLRYSDPAVLAGMTRREVEATRTVFGFEGSQHLLTRWDSLQKADGKMKATMDQEDFNHIADQLGLKPFDPKKSESERRSLGELKYRIEQVVDMAQRQKGAELSRPEKMELMRQEMAKTVAVPTWFGMSSDRVPVVQLTPDQAAKVVVPPTDRVKIVDALREMSKVDPNNPLYAPTEANVRRLYLSRQSPAGALIEQPK